MAKLNFGPIRVEQNKTQERWIVTVSTLGGERVEIGTFFRHKYSGWHGGGQSWHFTPHNSLALFSGYSTTLGDTKDDACEELAAFVSAALEAADPDSRVRSDLPILVKYTKR